MFVDTCLSHPYIPAEYPILKPLRRLSTRFWSMDVGICPFSLRSIKIDKKPRVQSTVLFTQRD